MAKFNKENFCKDTWAIFNSARRPKRDPDYISESGSLYWYTQKGVYRCSNHWVNIILKSEESIYFPSDEELKESEINSCSKIKSCFWSIKTKDLKSLTTKTGFCFWKNFNALNSEGNLLDFLWLSHSFSQYVFQLAASCMLTGTYIRKSVSSIQIKEKSLFM